MTERESKLLYLVVAIMLALFIFLLVASLTTPARASISIPPVIKIKPADAPMPNPGCVSWRCIEDWIHQGAKPKLLPKKPAVKVIRRYTARVTIYQSVPGQTDSDPFHTANGEHVYWGGVAVNCIPFGTKIRIPKVFGNKVFKVNDRGGMKCGDVDVWTERDNFHHWKGTTNTLIQIVK